MWCKVCRITSAFLYYIIEYKYIVPRVVAVWYRNKRRLHASCRRANLRGVFMLLWQWKHQKICTSILNLQEGWAYRRFPQPFRPEALVKSASVFFLSGIKVFSFLRSSSFSLRYSLSCDGHHTRVPRPSYERMVAAVQTVPQSPYNHSVPIFVYPFRCS